MPAHKCCLFTGDVEEDRCDVCLFLLPVSCLKKPWWLFTRVRRAHFGRFGSLRHESHDSVTNKFKKSKNREKLIKVD